ncbi:MAG: DUF1828 domain-containing protein [Firmicutes bacterium]|nr:DUF1828 domain-containing protein [Bacillota bacterium]
MNINYCLNYVNRYLAWLKSKSEVICRDEFCHIVTPFLRNDNDNIEVFIEFKNNQIVLSDDGASFEYLMMRGIDIDTKSRQQFLNSIWKRTNTYFDGYEIKSDILSENNFEIQFNNFINAIISVSNIVHTAQFKQSTNFKDDVKYLLDKQNINYRNINISGYSVDYNFDLVVFKRKPIIIEPLSATSSYYGMTKAQTTAFQWGDLKRNDNNFIGISLVDDRKDVWSKESIKILRKNSDEMIYFSNSKRLIDIIA